MEVGDIGDLRGGSFRPTHAATALLIINSVVGRAGRRDKLLHLH